MSEAHAISHDAPHPNYMAIFWWLLVITIAEVGITFVDIPQGLMVSMLLVMAFGKAALVALYFMHLKFDNKILMVIAVVPVILAGIAVGVVSYEFTHYTIPASADQQHIPSAPAGHHE